MRLSPKDGLFLIPLLLAIHAGAGEIQALKGHVPKAVANLSPTGRLPATQRLKLAIGLPLRNQQELGDLLREIYDPRSPNYHHYLTPAEFAARFGPTEQDYDAVAAFAETNGLRVTTRHPNRTLLDVEGSVADIEKALHVRMNNYAHPSEKRMFYAPDREPSVELAVPILAATGLDNYALPRPHLRVLPAPMAEKPKPYAGSGVGGTYSGYDFRAAYAPNTTLTGAGQIVGLVEFADYDMNDIVAYEDENGLPHVPVTRIVLDGAVLDPDGVDDENLEVRLDIEMAIAMAPGLSNVISYEEDITGNWDDMLNRIATDDVAKQIGCSWGTSDGIADPVSDQIFLEMAAQGQSFFNASGDSDAYTGLIGFPGDTPYITEVGGTTLTTSGPGGAWVSETVWNWAIEYGPAYAGEGSGGGISTQYPIPSWQASLNMTANFGSTTMRNMPDVALTADNVDTFSFGTDWSVGGTSCAAPLWAGFTALMNQQAQMYGRPSVGFINPAIYALGESSKYGQAFHDITTGNNGSPTQFPAVPGYDLATGWGAPAGQPLIDAIVPPDTLVIFPVGGFSIDGTAGGPFSSTEQTFRLTNISPVAEAWSAGNLPAWLDASSTGGLLPAGSTTNLILSVNSITSNLPPSTYRDNFTVTNLTSGFLHTLPLTLQLHDPLVITPTNDFVATGPVGGPFSVTSQNYAISNSGLASINWTLTNPLPWLSASPGSGSLSPGAGATVNIGLNAVASNLPVTFSVGDVTFSDVTRGISQQRGFSLQTGEVPIQNGGFETGDFTGWTLSGNTNGVTITSDPESVHSGNYAAALGPPYSPGYLSQTLPTMPGHLYLVSFWLNNQGLPPVDFNVGWDGFSIFNETTVPTAATWTNIQLLAGAFGTNSVLQFGFENNPSFFGLDDITVVESTLPKSLPVFTTQPSNLTLNAGVTAVLTAAASSIPPYNFQWQFEGTNIVGATNPNLILSPVSPAEAGNYRCVVVNAFGATASSNALLNVNVPPCLTAPAGLISWWAAEGTAGDSAGLNPGLAHGGVTYVPGESGQAFSFDGVNGTVIVPDSVSLSLTNQITIEAWINPASLEPTEAIVSKSGGTISRSGYQLYLSQDVLGGSFYSQSGTLYYLLTLVRLIPGTWNHVAWTYDGSVMRLYFNGQVVDSQNIGPQVMAVSGNDFTIGSDQNVDGFFHGQIDEVGVYGVALSPDQIQAIYNTAASGKCLLPPAIANQPAPITVPVGTQARFEVAAIGSSPLSYQWRRNGIDVPSATNASLSLANAQLSQSGENYSVVVSNSIGSAVSSNAVLTVIEPLACFPPPANLLGWWAAEGNAADSYNTNNGTTGGNLGYAFGEVGRAFQFDGTSAYVRIPASASLGVGNGGGFTIEGWIEPADLISAHPVAEWNDGLNNAADASLGAGLWVNVPPSGGGSGPGCLYANIVDTENGWHAFSSPAGILNTNTMQHIALTYDKSSGTGRLYLNGTNVASQNLGVFTPQTGYYLFLGYRPPTWPYPATYYSGLIDEMTLYGRALAGSEIQAVYNVTSSGKCPVSPVISRQPPNETLFAGTTASLSVDAVGNQPLRYQWYVNGSNLPAATNATLTLDNVQLGQSGNLYSVAVGNLLGSTNSADAVLSVLTPGSCLPPSSGLAGWWAAEGSTADTLDKNNGTAYGNLGYAPGEVGQAFQFDATSSFVRIPASASLDVGKGTGFTIEGWINPSQVSTQAPLVEWNNGANYFGPALWINQQQAYGGGGAGSLFANIIDDYPGYGHVLSTAGNLLLANTFYHVALTYDKTSGMAALYINGTNVASQNLGVFTPATGFDVYLGARPGQVYFAGLMDEMTVYNVALSSSQIEVIYQAGAAGKCPYPPTITINPLGQAVEMGCPVTFTAAASGSGSLAYQWQQNSTNLTGQTGTNLYILSVQSSDFGNYTMVASNTYGMATSRVARLTPDRPPVPGTTIVQRYLNGGVRLNASTVLSHATDPDGGSITLVAVDSNSVAGGTVSFSGTSIYYLPPAGFANSDAFGYTLSDGHCGGTAIGTVQVQVRGDSNPASHVTILQPGDGTVQVIFDGEPGTVYRVQSTDNLSPADWRDAATLTADKFGTYIYVTNPSTNGPAQFFRSVSP